MSDVDVSDAVLSIEGLTAGYGSPVLREVSIAARAGEVTALLGANGAGKTTTLRAISGIVEPMAGRVVFDGVDLAGRSIAQRARAGIAHVPENRGIFYQLTVADHFRLSHRGETLDRDTAIDYFPALHGLLDRRAGLLSGGEQQMLAMARALARRPKLLLLDELTHGLAPIIVQSLLPIVRSYAADSGCAVLLVEQHIKLALDVADRGYVLSHGDLVLEGDAETLRSDRALLLASYFGVEAEREMSGVHGKGA